MITSAEIHARYEAAVRAYYGSAANELHDSAQLMLQAEVQQRFPTATAVTIRGEFDEEMELRVRLTSVVCPEGTITDEVTGPIESLSEADIAFDEVYEATIECLDHMAATMGGDYQGGHTIAFE